MNVQQIMDRLALFPPEASVLTGFGYDNDTAFRPVTKVAAHRVQEEQQPGVYTLDDDDNTSNEVIVLVIS